MAPVIICDYMFLFLVAVTGSCFFIFSSALKASAGYLAKSSIVEGRMSTQRGVTFNPHDKLPTCRNFILYMTILCKVHVHVL